MSTQHAYTLVDVTGSTKQYFVENNWWHQFNGQTVKSNGLSFTVGNPAGAKSSDSDPTGYASIWLGAFAGLSTRGSNLPKQVSALTGVPARLATNANSMGKSNYAANLQLWFSPKDQIAALGPGCQQCTGGQGPGNIALSTACGQIICGTDFRAYQCQESGGSWRGLGQSCSPSALGAGGAYLMVWAFMPTDRQPRGTKAHPAQTVTGLPGTWDVWMESADPPYITYVSTTPNERLELDLNNVIQDAVKNNYGITKNMYLAVISGGFQVWAGGDGLQLQSLCANVL